jgi:cytochrome c-type biogenesis protein CcmF
VLYPAKWTFAKGEQQQTTEVAIKVRWATEFGFLRHTEDIYVVLTGYNMEAKQANFRVYLNPLISWVWIGFFVLAAGVFICLIPQGLVDRLQAKPRSQLGRAAELGIVLLVSGALVAGLSGQANAAPAPAEHVPAGMGMGNAGGGYAAMNRPPDELSKKAMQELICPCGCARQNIFDCDCATAAQLRKRVIDLLRANDEHGKPLFDLSTDVGRKQAYDTVLASFVKEYGGEQILATPQNRFSWLFIARRRRWPELARRGRPVLGGGRAPPRRAQRRRTPRSKTMTTPTSRRRAP